MIDELVLNGLLEERKILTPHDTWGYQYFVTKKGESIFKRAYQNENEGTRIKIGDLNKKFKFTTPSDIVRYVYLKYPDWNPHNTRNC